MISLPHYGSNVPKNSLLGVVVSQLHRLFRANSYIDGFYNNVNILFAKLCKQGFLKGHLLNLLRNFESKNYLSIIYKYWEVIDFERFN